MPDPKLIEQAFSFAQSHGLLAMFALVAMGGTFYVVCEAVRNGFSIRVNGRKQ